MCSGEGDGCRRNTDSLEDEETVGVKGARKAAGIVCTVTNVDVDVESTCSVDGIVVLCAGRGKVSI